MAPEQGRGGGDVDARADVWGASLVLYEAVLGAPALAEQRSGQLARLRRPEALACEPELWAVVARGLEEDPGARWPSARMLATELARWASARGATCDAAGLALADLWRTA
jgi:serine/threonine-protein kinase